MMPSQRFRRPYTQRNDFERGRLSECLKLDRDTRQKDVSCNLQTLFCKGAGRNGWCEELIDEIKALVGQDKSITLGVTVWGALLHDRRSSIVIFHTSLTAQRYVGTILRPMLLLSMARHPGTSFQQHR
ncbi:hypothetical protein TNCV_1887871 [Trichonephila clavipes]|nr:hypothetical protein TNCV_1887871 [Trichonephila clavipes]